VGHRSTRRGAVREVDAVLEKSGATDEQITALSEAVKGDWWSANKGQFLKRSQD